MKTTERYQSFLATSSRKYFKIGLALSILFSIGVFKLPLYSKVYASTLPIIDIEEMVNIDYVKNVSKTTEPIKEKPPEIKKPTTLINVTVEPLPVAEPVVLPVEPPITETGTTITKVIAPVIIKTPPTVDFAEIMPEFKNGYEGIFAFFNANINYPEQAIDMEIEGKVYVRFIVNTLGEVTLVEIAKGVHPLLDKEAMRVVKTMPNWSPGSQNGNNVNVVQVVPINFVLQ